MGLNTITDFLQKKGIKTDGSPNTLVEPDVYAVLEKAGAELPATNGKASGSESPRSRLRSPSKRHRNRRAKRSRR